MEAKLHITAHAKGHYYYGEDSPYHFQYKDLIYQGDRSTIVTGNQLGTIIFDLPKTHCSLKVRSYFQSFKS